MMGETLLEGSEDLCDFGQKWKYRNVFVFTFKFGLAQKEHAKHVLKTLYFEVNTLWMILIMNGNENEAW